MYEIVIKDKGKEVSVFTTEDKLEAELRRQRHIRSLSGGVAEVRVMKKDKAKGE